MSYDLRKIQQMRGMPVPEVDVVIAAEAPASAPVVRTTRRTIRREPASAPAPAPASVPTIAAVSGDWIVPDDPPVATVVIYDVDRPRRDPTAFADVDPLYVEQIELRQEVQQLGRAVQTDPESEVARERLAEKYEEYIEVRKERGAVIPSAEVQARAVDPRSAAELATGVQRTVVPAPVVQPEPLVVGLEPRADSAFRKLLFLGIVASIVKGLSK